MRHFSHTKKGSLEVVCGSMFSGKTEELIRRVDRARIAKQRVQVFKHAIDKRKHDDSDPTHWLTSRTGSKIQAMAVNYPQEILDYVDAHDIEVIGIDEIHFFPIELITVVSKLLWKQKRIIAAGLDLNFRGEPFPCVATLLAIADEVLKLKAICASCQADTFCLSQRIINGKPARYDDPVILVGADEYYIPRCRACYEINEQPDLTEHVNEKQPKLSL